MMAVLADNPRRQSEARFPSIVVILVPLIALFLQALLPLRIPLFDLFELPLLVVIYFAMAWQNPVAGTVLGVIVGLFQDGLMHQPFGVNGIAKTAVGYLAATVGLKVDSDNQITRLLASFAFTLLASGLYFAIVRHLLATEIGWSWPHELIKAGVNAVTGVLVFALLDRMRRRE
jgi:rod shape-determining protein MreD